MSRMAGRLERRKKLCLAALLITPYAMDYDLMLLAPVIALMATEGLTLIFTEDAIDAIADAAVSVNSSVENIGARRLQTVMERVLDEISFSASDRAQETVTVDGDYVRSRVADLAKNADLSRFIL